jgi:hypothetical protein
MGSGDPAADTLSPLLRHPGALTLTLSRRVAMARDATAAAVPARLLDLLPLIVVLLIAAHVLALVRFLPDSLTAHPLDEI